MTNRHQLFFSLITLDLSNEWSLPSKISLRKVVENGNYYVVMEGKLHSNTADIRLCQGWTAKCIRLSDSSLAPLKTHSETNVTYSNLIIEVSPRISFSLHSSSAQ